MIGIFFTAHMWKLVNIISKFTSLVGHGLSWGPLVFGPCPPQVLCTRRKDSTFTRVANKSSANIAFIKLRHCLATKKQSLAPQNGQIFGDRPHFVWLNSQLIIKFICWLNRHVILINRDFVSWIPPFLEKTSFFLLTSLFFFLKNYSLSCPNPNL